ncbi:MAG TPA: metallopeptidase TldD-related protein [Vicinamibacterales bacterium]|nr:metallopeptidase TldD-related protein [Vicinamibacterales bacterium]
MASKALPHKTSGRVSIVVAIVIGVSVAVWEAPSPHAQDTPVLAAMADELARSMKELRLRDQPAPYFIEYEVEDRAATRVTSRFGALVEDLTGRSRVLRVGVRVGTYDFDSSLFNAPGGGGGGVVSLTADGSTNAPLDDDYDAMRRQIWLATDAAYKRAVSVFARKKAAFQNRASAETVPDFSRETPAETVLKGLPLAFVNRDWPERTKQISAAFNGFPMIENGEASAADTRGTRYYLNSEGSKVVAPIQIASLRVAAEARADDGSTVRDVFTLVEQNLQDMPPVAELVTRARQMAERVKAVRTAPIGEEYTGPLLLEGQASAELVAQALIPPMLARRPPETAGRGGRGGGPAQVTPFHRRLGLRVLTEPFSVSDTPSLREFGGRPVAGAYVVDDYGVKAKDVVLVEKGRLVTLLTGRAPLRGLLQSSGHTRGGDVQAGVFQVQSSDAVSAGDLRKKYLAVLKTQDRSFGYIVRGIANPNDAGGGGPGAGPLILDAVKVTPDGKEHVVRGVRLGSVASSAFRDLLDASRERTLYNYRGTTTDPVSVIVPSLIFEELEVQQTREITQKPPVVSSPSTN